MFHDRRFRGMALLPLQDPKAAVKELRRVVKRYVMVGGILPADGLSCPSDTSNTGRSSRKATSSAARFRCTRATRCAITTAIRAERSRDADPCIPQMRQFTNIMFSGVMNKLKKLRLGFLEAGCGWTPFLIE